MVRGLLGLRVVIQDWSQMSDLSIIDKAYSPLPFLILALSEACAGALLFMRRRWIFLAVGIALSSFTYVYLAGQRPSSMPPLVSLKFAEQLAVLAFCIWLQLRGRLK